MKKFVVDRKRWGRGGIDGALLNNSGQKCCLGFLATACGIRLKRGTMSDFTDIPAKQQHFLPEKLRCKKDKFGGLVGTKLHNDLVEVNDSFDIQMRGRAREAKLTKLFRRAGVQVTFR